MRRQRKLLIGLLGFPFFLVITYLIFEFKTLKNYPLSSYFFSSTTEMSHMENSLHQIGTNQNLAIFSVFLDKRVSDNQTEVRSLHGHLNGVLRIILAKKRGVMPEISCLFDDGTLVPSRDLHGRLFSFYELTENHQQLYGGYSVHCDVPPFVDLTKGVKICTDGPEFGEVFMPIIHANASKIETLPSKTPRTTQYKHRFSVCVPALHHIKNLNKKFLVDWLKVHIRFGVTNFRIYYSEVIPNSLRTIFESIGAKAKVELHPVYWKENNRAVLHDSWYYLQILTVNDCLFRSLYDTEYAFFGDLDEALVPHSKNISDWSELVGRIWTDRNVPGICFPAYQFKESPSGMADSLTRLSGIDSLRKKCLVRPRAIFEMGIHHISKPFEESAAFRSVSSLKILPYAIIHHYHRPFSKFQDEVLRPPEEVVDTSILRFLGN
ncbi:hypothetical protein Aperf_G00000120238 [Anoplocephala perfoliata]